MLNRTDTYPDDAGREAFQALIAHLAGHVGAPDDAGCPRCAVLRDRYQQDRAERLARRAGVPQS